MWRVVLAVWLVTTAVFLPARVVVLIAAAEAFAAVPDGSLPDGELLLITVELLRPVWAPLAMAVLSGWLALWAWTVLWHAGVVRWFVLSGRSGVRLTEILGRGLLDWWRWARLGLTAMGALVLGASVLWLAIGWADDHVLEHVDDRLLGGFVAAAAALSLAMVVLVWLATLRGAWLLGVGNRRSAVLAWVDGLWGSLRHPVSSLVTLALWSVPALAAIAVPLLVGWNFEVLRSPLPSAIIDAAAGLFAAFCLVGLFLSFAPVTGRAAENRVE
jgi:hypothetical protein